MAIQSYGGYTLGNSEELDANEALRAMVQVTPTGHGNSIVAE